MNISVKNKFAVAGFLVVAVMAMIGQAQASDAPLKQAGDWQVALQSLSLVPKESSDVSIGGNAKVNSNTVPALDIRYFLTDKLALGTILGSSQHDISAIGTALGDVDLGSSVVLPTTLAVQYHAANRGGFSPYIGAGISYTFFVDQDPGAVRQVKIDDSFGWVVNIGFDYFLDDTKYVNFDIKKYLLSTDASIDAGPAGTANASIDLNPLTLGFGVGWLF